VSDTTIIPDKRIYRFQFSRQFVETVVDGNPALAKFAQKVGLRKTSDLGRPT
jgi:hypothetical protein